MKRPNARHLTPLTPVRWNHFHHRGEDGGTTDAARLYRMTARVGPRSMPDAVTVALTSTAGPAVYQLMLAT